MRCVCVCVCSLLKGDYLPECSAALTIHIWANRNDSPKKHHQWAYNPSSFRCLRSNEIDIIWKGRIDVWHTICTLSSLLPTHCPQLSEICLKKQREIALAIRQSRTMGLYTLDKPRAELQVLKRLFCSCRVHALYLQTSRVPERSKALLMTTNACNILYNIEPMCMSSSVLNICDLEFIASSSQILWTLSIVTWPRMSVSLLRMLYGVQRSKKPQASIEQNICLINYSLTIH